MLKFDSSPEISEDSIEEPKTPKVILINDSEDEDQEDWGIVSAADFLKTTFQLNSIHKINSEIDQNSLNIPKVWTTKHSFQEKCKFKNI